MIENTLEGSPENAGTTSEAHAQPLRKKNQSNGQDAIPAPNDRRAKVEHLFGQVNWKDETTGFITCPGQETHTSKNGPQDCQVKIDNVPTVYCVHQSCAEEIKSANMKLRDAVKSSSVRKRGQASFHSVGLIFRGLPRGRTVEARPP
jgi:hypothetical protein